MNSEYPREKIQRLGPAHLDDQELISLLLSCGSKKESVFEISKRVMHGFDRENLKKSTFSDLKNKYELGNIHAFRILASIELGKRLFDEPISDRQIKSYEDIIQILRDMHLLKQEHVKGLYLNSRNFIIREETISIGSLDANIVHPREIFRPAIIYSAYAIIIAHNHPSGDPSPSESDKLITKQLTRIGKLLQIPLLDHIIIGKNSYFSFSEQQML